jgi:hypothetical protein
VTDHCGVRRHGRTCVLPAPDEQGVHPGVETTRHGGTDKRGVWHFWGTTLTVAERAQWLAASPPETVGPAS